MRIAVIGAGPTGMVLGAALASQGADRVVEPSGGPGRPRASDHDGASEIGQEWPDRPAVVGGPCGIAYVDRTYRLRPGAGGGPWTSRIGWFGSFDGYLVLVFP